MDVIAEPGHDAAHDFVLAGNSNLAMAQKQRKLLDSEHLKALWLSHAYLPRRDETAMLASKRLRWPIGDQGSKLKSYVIHYHRQDWFEREVNLNAQVSIFKHELILGVSQIQS